MPVNNLLSIGQGSAAFLMVSASNVELLLKVVIAVATLISQFLIYKKAKNGTEKK